MRVIVHPVMEPQREIDVADRLVAAIAEELWRLYGGNEQLNWLEAEAHLRQIIDGKGTTTAAPNAVRAGANGSTADWNDPARSSRIAPADTSHRSPHRRVRRRRSITCVHR